MHNEYICDDRNVLETLRKIRSMTDEEFKKYLEDQKSKSDKE